MTDLIRRRMMMARGGAPNAWDGKCGIALDAHGNVYYTLNYGASWTQYGNVASATSANDRIVLSECTAYIVSNRATDYTKKLYFYSESSTSTDLRMTGTSYRNYWSPVVSMCATSCSQAKRWTKNSSGSIFSAKNSGTSWETGYTTTLLVSSGSSEQYGKTLASFSTDDQAAPSASACSADGKYILVGGLEGYSNAFYSNNFGVSWGECLSSESYGGGTRDVAISGDGHYALTCTDLGWNWSQDFLATWTVGNVSNAWRTVAISGDGRYRFISNGVKLLKGSPDTWYTANATANLYRVRTNWYGTRLVGINSNGRPAYSADGGYTWATASATQGSTGASVTASFIDIAINRVPNDNVPDRVLALS